MNVKYAYLSPEMYFNSMYDMVYQHLLSALDWKKTPDFLELGLREETTRLGAEYVTLYVWTHTTLPKAAPDDIIAAQREGLDQYVRYHNAKRHI